MKKVKLLLALVVGATYFFVNGKVAACTTKYCPGSSVTCDIENQKLGFKIKSEKGKDNAAIEYEGC